MCTLIIGRDVLGARSVLLGANRDEDPARLSDPPRILVENPVVVGGRDQVAGGTWLAVREGRAAVAILNRHDPVPAGVRRSRGKLALDAASASVSDRGGTLSPGEALAEAAGESLQRALARERYAPFTLVFAAPDTCWLVSSASGAGHKRAPGLAREAIPPGWHVLTHRDLDDPGEPRAVHLLAALHGFRPGTVAEAEARLMDLLRSHGGPDTPPVCIHHGRMQTVSSSLVWLDREGARYLHAEGRPCEHAFEDQGALLGSAAG